MQPKIFILIPSLRMGGAENVLINFLNLLDLDRYHVTLGVALLDGSLIEKVPKKVRIVGLTRSELIIRVTNFLYARFGVKVLLRRLTRKLRGDYDLAICFQDSVFTDYILLSNLRFKRSLSVVQSNYTTYPEKSKYFRGAHKRRVLERYNNLDQIVAVSQTVKEGFEQLYGSHNNITVSYNPINSRKVLNLANEPLEIEFSKGEVNLVAIGRLVPVKGYDNLIKAAARLKDQDLKFKIRIIGSGPLKEKLQNLITNLDVAEVVELLGFVENPYPLLKSSDIFVMTSYSEGLPTALCEAMILNLPILSTDASGCKEILDDGCFGLQVKTEVEAIAKGLESLLKSDELRLKYRGLSKERADLYNDNNSMKFYTDQIALSQS